MGYLIKNCWHFGNFVLIGNVKPQENQATTAYKREKALLL